MTKAWHCHGWGTLVDSDPELMVRVKACSLYQPARCHSVGSSSGAQNPYLW